MMSCATSDNVVVNPYLKKRKRPQTSPQPLSCETSQSTGSTVSEEHRSCPSSSSSKRVVNNNNNNNSSSRNKISNDTIDTDSSTIDNVSASASALIISAADKAGMEGIDRSKIDAIILRESGNSLYMQQQRKRDEKVNQRIQHMKERLQDASPKEYQVTAELEEQLETYIRQAPTRSTCVVIDMDMFYMACELLTRPHLKDVPACVGHGMITTSNYVARRYGVRSAMAGFIGDKLVEELSGGTQKLHHVPSNFALYREKSRIVKDVLREYDPFHMKSYSLDEAYLDIGPYLATYLQHQEWTHEQIRDHLLQSKTTITTTATAATTTTTHHNHNPSAIAMEYLQSLSSLACMQAANQVVAQLRERVTKATGGLTCSAV
ncbi:DNA polymerase IV [Nitzschia inconspicua]|uniref:DNA polymerase IV n=1 Tax=Nitzschia inconspicua TaxID=303405 RepID=A0A9K3L5D3_9STRA|nr:DNA polymerase IV [Nitzschia inconspicua]